MTNRPTFANWVNINYGDETKIPAERLKELKNEFYKRFGIKKK